MEPEARISAENLLPAVAEGPSLEQGGDHPAPELPVGKTTDDVAKPDEEMVIVDEAKAQEATAEEPEPKEEVETRSEEAHAEENEEPPKSAAKQAKQAADADAEGGGARRERKTVEHFKIELPKEKEAVVPQGSGPMLRDIPNVAFKMSKVSGRDELMETLHNVIYRRKGQGTTRKKSILDFSGFAFTEDQQEREMDARKTSLSKVKLDVIHRMLDVLDLQRGTGDKAAKVERILDFLNKPSIQSNVDLAAKETAKKEKAKKKREREAKKREPSATKKAKTASKRKAKKEAAAEASETEDQEHDSSDVQEEEVLPKKVRKSGEGQGKPNQPAKQGGKAEAAAAPAATGDPASSLSAERLKQDIEAYLAKLTDDELSAMTRKTVMAAMEKQYGFELRSRKAEVKEAAQLYAEKRLGPAASPAAGAAAKAAGDPAAAAAIATEANNNGNV